MNLVTVNAAMSLLNLAESGKPADMSRSAPIPVPNIIREELARRRMSRASLAADAKISLSSLEKGLSGQREFTEQTLVRLEEALGISLRRKHSMASIVAPDSLGSYSRPAVNWIEGNYLTVRPSTTRPGAVYSYSLEIMWNETDGHLSFIEKARLDTAYTQSGQIAIPHQTGHIYFVTNRHGQHRLMLMQRHGKTGEMFGLLLTLQQGKGPHLMPVSMPVALIPFRNLPEAPSFGTISENHSAHTALKNYLDRCINGGFAMMMV